MDEKKKPDFIEDLQSEDSGQVPFEAIVAEEPAAADSQIEAEENIDAEEESGRQDHGKQQADEEIQTPQSLKEFMNADEETHTNFSLRTILGGDIFNGRWFKRHFPFIILLSVMAIIYISNRYAYEFDMLEQKELTDTLHDRRYKVLTRSSQLLEKKLRSNVEEDLADSTIQTATTPSYVIKINEQQ